MKHMLFCYYVGSLKATPTGEGVIPAKNVFLGLW